MMTEFGHTKLFGLKPSGDTQAPFQEDSIKEKNKIVLILQAYFSE
jgi:hypothetical protein